MKMRVCRLSKIAFFILIMAILTPVAFSQSDGGKKKKKPVKTEQTQQQRQRQQAEAKRKQEEQARQQREAEARRQSSGYINGHEWINLGLPSGTKWATCNVGASSPSDYGSYFAWGETSPKSAYTEANSKTYKKSIGDISGNPVYDAARANWGGTWRMPTKAESQELVDKCSWTWTTQGGKKGYKVTGPNGNSIFLPAAGDRYGTSLDDAGEYGFYWCSTPSESVTETAYFLWIYESFRLVHWYYRYYGQSVRPVAD